MKIPLYTSGPDREFSYGEFGTQRIRVAELSRADAVCVESYKIRNYKAWALKTNGLPAGMSRPCPSHQLSAARGVIAGVLLGASLWGAILAFVGQIRL
ncbi:MAG: hypothetical protein ABSG03_04960 [Bryobacteraceae bacterium]|jgi:hypothetical protein